MTEEPGLTALPGYAAALFLLCMMFYNRTCISEMEGEDWWEINNEWLEHHPIAYSVFKGLMLTDMVRKQGYTTSYPARQTTPMYTASLTHTAFHVLVTRTLQELVALLPWKPLGQVAANGS